MAEILSVLEHESISIVPSRQPNDKTISTVHAEQIEHMITQKRLPSGAVSWSRYSVKFSQYCGVIQLSDLTIEILPKIYNEEFDDQVRSRDVLIQMLKLCGYLKLHRSSQASIRQQTHTILDVFILAFCQELNAQLATGLIRKYIDREENLNVLRGKLLIGLQSSHNFVHKERMYCRYDELSVNTLINQIIKFTLRKLSMMAYSAFAKKRVNELLLRFDAVSDTIISKDKLDPILDRTNIRYQNILDQCKLFILGSNPDVVAGQGRAFAFLFNMNQLFEKWVVAKLRPMAREQEVKLDSHGPIRNFGKWQESTGKSEVFQMIPDITLLSNNRYSIADVKWKELDQEQNNLNVDQSDLYQMLSYANRYEAESIILFYPKQQAFTTSKILKINGKHSPTVEFIPVDITKSEPFSKTLPYLNLRS